MAILDKQHASQSEQNRTEHNFILILHLGAPGVLGIWGEGLFIFWKLGGTCNYFRGAGEQEHTYGDLGSTAKK